MHRHKIKGMETEGERHYILRRAIVNTCLMTGNTNITQQSNG